MTDGPDVGFLCDARHGADESSLFEFSFELDVDAMDEAGFGHCAMFSFVVDFKTGKAVKLTSSSDPDVIAALVIHALRMRVGWEPNSSLNTT